MERQSAGYSDIKEFSCRVGVIESYMVKPQRNVVDIKKEQAMAVRKPMIGPKPERSELDQKIKEALKNPLTDDQFEKQKASFAYGNAPDSDYITKDSVMKAIHSFRLKEAA
jgi:hypothetical protein